MFSTGHSYDAWRRLLPAGAAALVMTGGPVVLGATPTTPPVGTVVAAPPPGAEVVGKLPPGAAVTMPKTVPRVPLDRVTLAKAVTDVWLRAGEIWPGADYSELSLLIVGTRAATLFAPGLPPRERSLESLNSIRVPAPLGFGFVKVDGRDTVAMSIPDGIPPALAKRTDPFAILSHEAFHQYVQRRWPRPRTGSGSENGRATEYPLKAAPRVARAELQVALEAALTDPSTRTEGLARASYWWRRWQRIAPGEAASIRDTDASEGTARYFEAMASARAKVGWTATEQQLTKALVGATRGSTGGVSADGESYPLGLLAGALLDRTQSNPAAWKGEVAAKGTPPVEILLRDITPPAATSSTAVDAEVRAAVRISNRQARPAVDLFREASRGKRALLVLPQGSSAGSYAISGGFFATPGLPLGSPSLVSGLSTTLALGGTGGVKLTNAAVLDGPRVSFCGRGGPYLVVALPRGVRPTGPRLKITSGPVRVNLLAVGPAKRVGRTVAYCVR